MAEPAPTAPALRGAAMVAVGFGALTVVSGAVALGGVLDMGAVVPFVLWFNFLAGFAYIGAGVGLWRRRRWGLALALAILAATVAVAGAFGLHVAGGGAFEPRTVGALLVRAAVWAAIGVLAWRALGPGGAGAARRDPPA